MSLRLDQKHPLDIKVAFFQSHKARIHKNIKVCFQTVKVILGDCCLQNQIPGKILILLDTHNLSVGQKLPNSDLPKMANGSGKWQMWQCLIWAIFYVQTSYGCLKVSEFYQESDSENKNHHRQYLQSENKHSCFL